MLSHLAIQKLHSWYQSQKRVLPWRDQPSLYAVWVSEIMLQQTQVKTVLPFFERFIEAFPTVEKLASAPESEVLRLWSGLGYYSRARNLHRGAQKIVAESPTNAAEVEFPQTREEWLEIPGVGPYTAGAIVSIALNEPVPILDGNVERVVSRYLALKEHGTERKKRLWKVSEDWVHRAFEREIPPRDFNQALMELGAMVCTPKKPACLLCPLKKDCTARAEGSPEAYPLPKPRKEWIRVEEQRDYIENAQGEILLERSERGWRQGLWDLPERDENQRGPSLRQVEVRYVVTRHKVRRLVRVLKKTSRTTRAAEPYLSGSRKWVSLQSLTQGKNPELPIGSALRKSLIEVRETES